MAGGIIFDTETTGFDPDDGDRVIEIAALKLNEDDMPLEGATFHVVIDPERDVPAESTRIHGFRTEDVRGKPLFADIAQSFVDFVGDAKLIAHNASFDFKFINAELTRCGMRPYDYASRAVDTLAIAKSRYTGPVNLDALCRRFGIDLSARTTHNALLDCQLLAQVYVELQGGRQRGLGLGGEGAGIASPLARSLRPEPGRYAGRQARTWAVPEADKARHEAFLESVTDPLWRRA
ncbi:DNA polymerase III subunit epsilon [Formicincola oecophyllae]|uniref:DNA polymerase III subunit epsilon n=1 Tax=Formicincola oecophyllae TaxID=2558361 RepID=A0A4Y6U7C0_9PROT|nr:DNA polymerase III subunit epsilon [Formicincola oecophyllae]QDH12920.1 DNA polymerase III subunit epsilon [Formicincola oecophyllae]